MKNTLAENLLRFGVKNLSEAEKQSLNEQATNQESWTVIPMIISMPYKKDSTGKQIFDEGNAVNVTAVNQQGKGGGNLVDYDNIETLEFGGTMAVKVFRSKKQANGNITASFSVYNNKPLVEYLKKLVGKTTPPGDKRTLTVTLTGKGGTNTLYTAGTVFNTYDTTAAAKPSQPAAAPPK